MKIYKVKRAYKDYPDSDIKKGDSYCYCRPKNRPKVRMKSEENLRKWIKSYALSFRGEFGNNMEEWQNRISDREIEGLREEIEEFRDQKQENLENMPYDLQEGHILNEQIEELDELLEELDED